MKQKIKPQIENNQSQLPPKYNHLNKNYYLKVFF